MVTNGTGEVGWFCWKFVDNQVSKLFHFLYSYRLVSVELWLKVVMTLSWMAKCSKFKFANLAICNQTIRYIRITIQPSFLTLGA